MHQQARRNSQLVIISWPLLFRNLVEALLHLSTIPLLEKNGGCAIYIYVTAIKPKNYCSWGLGPHRTVLKVCWILQLHVIFIISSSLTLEGSYLC